MIDLRKLIKWMFALVLVAYIQQKSAIIFGGKFTELFPIRGLEVITNG